MLYKIGEFSTITNTSIRTLRYYDEINLLKPIEIDLFTGYRYYSDKEIEDLKVIKILKELNFSLEEIINNWNKFNNDLFLRKKEELLKEMELYKIKIKEIDDIRSNLQDGKIMFNKKEKVDRIRMKTIYNNERKIL